MAKTKPIKIRIVGDTKKLEGAFDTASSKAGKFGKVMGGAMLGGGAAVGAFGVKSVQAFAGFEQGMREITSLPGVATENLKPLSDGVLDLNKKMGITSDQSVPALYDSLSAGIPEDNVFTFMEDAQKLAVAGNVDTQASVDVLTTAINSYGLEAEDAGKVSDTLFAGVGAGKTTIDELGSSLFQVAPIAAGMNVSIEDVTAGIATLTAKGVPTAQAANSMKAAFSELGKAGSAADKAFQEASGKTFPEFIKQGGDLESALGLMAKSSEETGVSVNNMFGSVEAGTAFASMAADLDFTGEKFDAIGQSAGVTEDAFANSSQGMMHQFNLLKASGEATLIKVGSGFGAFLAAFQRNDGQALNDGVLGKIEGLAFKARDAFDNVRAFLETNRPKIQKFFTDTWEKAQPLIDTMKNVGEAIGNINWSSLSESDAFKKTEGVVQSVAGVVRSFGKLVGAILARADQFWKAHGEKITKFAVEAFKHLMNVVGPVIDGIKHLVDTVTALINGDWSQAWDSFKKVFGSLATAAVNALKGLWPLLKTIVGAALQGLWNLAKLALKGLVELFKRLPGWIWSGLKSLGGLLVKLAKGAFKLQMRAFAAGIKAVVEFVKKQPERIAFALGALAGLWYKVAKGAFGLLKRGITEGVPALINYIKGLPRKLANGLQALYGFLKTKGTNAIIGLKNGMIARANDTVAWVRRLPGRIRSGIPNAGRMLYTTGRNILIGLKNGLISKWGDIKRWIDGKVSSIKDSFTSGLGIFSPSRVFMSYGENIVEGLQIGMDSLDPSVPLPGPPTSPTFASLVTGQTGNGSQSRGVTIAGDVHVHGVEDPEDFLRKLDQMVSARGGF